MRKSLVSKLVAASLFFSGMLVFSSGFSLQARAVECPPSQTMQGLVCDRAQPSNHYTTPGTNLSCHLSGEKCVESAGSRCGDFDGYQYTLNGMCIHELPMQPYAFCVENHSKTWVTLQYVVGICNIEFGTCQCWVYYNFNHPPQYSEVCDCYGTLN